MKSKKSLFILFLLCLKITGYCQKQAYIQYTTKSGLPSNNVYMAFQDSKGYLFFGTDAGLSRFDGYSFKNFDIQDGLPDNDIFDMLEDRKGRIWFATYNGKLGYLKDDKFHNSTNTTLLKGSNLSSYISCMYEDTKDNIWFGTIYNGIQYLDTNNEFHKILGDSLSNEIKHGNKTYAIWEDDIGDVFALTSYAIENLTKKETINLKDIGITFGRRDLRHCKVLPLEDGTLLLTENSNFYILDKHYKKILKKITYTSLTTTVLFLEKDLAGNIWAGTYKGMFKLDFNEEQNATPIDFLNGLTNSSRKEDSQGNTWCTTLEKGVYFLPSTEVINYTVNDALPEEKVNAVDGNDQGDIIIGQERYYSLMKNKEIQNFNNDATYELRQFKTTTKHIYDVSLENNGDHVVVSSTGITANIKNQNYYYSGQAARTAVTYKKDSIALGSSGLIKSRIFEMKTLSDDKDPPRILKDSLITAIYWNKKDSSFWVGLINGLVQIKGDSIISHSNKHPSLKSYITDIQPSNKNNSLWIATNGNGVLSLNSGGDALFNLTIKDGLSSNICKAITEDKNGKLWVATNNGLNKVIDERGKNISKYGYANGLLSDRINDIFIHKDKAWVATPQGLSMMDISKEKNYKTPIYIANMAVNGKNKTFNTNNNTLSHDENNVSIDFVALDYSMGGEVLYRYKIKEDQEWRYTSNNGIEFSSLKSEPYSFVVQAKNKQGIWSKETAVLNFTITKPWWQTQWAFTIFTLISFCFVLGAFKYESKKRQLRIELFLEKKESLRFKELDKFKSQFFANISHEIKTPLTLIDGYISDLNFDVPNNAKTEKNLKKQILKITNMVDSVLNLAKMQSSNFKLQLKPTNVSDLVRKLAINFQPLFLQKNIILEVPNNTTNYVTNIDIDFFEKAINNLIINALKYTDYGKVSIEIKEKKEKINIVITDTGIGIANDELQNVFSRFYQVSNDINTSGGSGIGLAFCKEIIELHFGKILLKSKLNIGSEFTIILPLEKSIPTGFLTNKANAKKQITEENIEGSKSPIKHTFLIVDDNYDMRKYLISILKDNHCIEAENGFEALKIIHKNNIDFIITDYMMPKLDGYAFISKLNTDDYKIPIIMLTAKTDTKTKLDVLKLGIDDYITKPFNKNELLTRINNCLKNNTARKSYIEKNNTTAVEISYESKFLNQLKDYIYTNSNNTSLNQDVIAEELNMSKSSFYRKIKSNTGLSPNNFIREIKLQKAREISQSNVDISLKELSYEVGFNHTSYFSKVYENRFGVKPLGHK